MHAYIVFIELGGKLCLKTVAAPGAVSAKLGVMAALHTIPLCVLEIPLSYFCN